MRIQGDKEALAEVGQAVLRVVSPRATLPVLGGVKITATGNEVEFAATDLEVFLSIKGELAVQEEGSVVVPGRLFGDILRSLPHGKVTVEGRQSEVIIQSGRTEFSLTGYAVGDFPQPPEVTGQETTRASGAELAKALRQVVRAASTDEARPVLTGVLWTLEGGQLGLVTTDSYRLAVRELAVKEGPGEARAIIPGRALAEFGRHLAASAESEAEIWLGETQAALTTGNVKLVTRLIEGEFPNWKKLIPEGYNSRLLFNRAEFSQAVERMALIARANTSVRFHLGPEVQLTAVEAGVAEAVEVVEGAEYEGEPMVIAFNPKFFTDGVDSIESERAMLEVIDPGKPALIRPEGAEGREDLYLLMPVRLPN